MQIFKAEFKNFKQSLLDSMMRITSKKWLPRRWSCLVNEKSPPGLFIDEKSPPGLFIDKKSPRGLFIDKKSPPGLFIDKKLPPGLFIDKKSPSGLFTGLLFIGFLL